MNILILDTKQKLLPAYYYCRDAGYDVKVIHISDYPPHDSKVLLSNSIKLKDMKDEIFYDFFPDQIINFKEQEEYLELENNLNRKFGLDIYHEPEFFSFKRNQDILFKKLNIPTVPNDGEIVLIKSDFSGGDGFKVANRKEASGFYQNYLDIDYIISCHFYSDGKYWYHLNNHNMKYVDNCPERSITPYQLMGSDKTIIEDSIRKLSNELEITNKLFGWQFLKDKSGNLYSIDFNLRPFGGFDMGSYDTDISDQNWCSYLFENIPPKIISYTHTIECFYLEKQQFGYSPWNRIKRKKELDFKVNTYNV